MKTELYRIEKYGVCRDLTFVDDGSGKTFNRSGWRNLKNRSQAGDVIVVSYLARLERDSMTASTFSMISQSSQTRCRQVLPAHYDGERGASREKHQ